MPLTIGFWNALGLNHEEPDCVLLNNGARKFVKGLDAPVSDCPGVVLDPLLGNPGSPERPLGTPGSPPEAPDSPGIPDVRFVMLGMPGNPPDDPGIPGRLANPAGMPGKFPVRPDSPGKLEIPGRFEIPGRLDGIPGKPPPLPEKFGIPGRLLKNFPIPPLPDIPPFTTMLSLIVVFPLGNSLQLVGDCCAVSPNDPIVLDRGFRAFTV